MNKKAIFWLKDRFEAGIVPLYIVEFVDELIRDSELMIEQKKRCTCEKQRTLQQRRR